MLLSRLSPPEEFRYRLIQLGRENQVLEQMLRCFVQKGLIQARGKARTDSTPVLAAIRQLKRIECVAERLRHALNELATVVPEWVCEQVNMDWLKRYGSRLKQSRFAALKPLPLDNISTQDEKVQDLSLG